MGRTNSAMKPVVSFRASAGELRLDNGLSIALAPAIADLRSAKRADDVTEVLDRVPPHLHPGLVEAVATRPALFPLSVARGVMQAIGQERAVEVLGLKGADNLQRRTYVETF